MNIDFIIEQEIKNWAVKLGIYDKPWLVNISDTIDLEHSIQDKLRSAKLRT